jgi:hypothetical protein
LIFGNDKKALIEVKSRARDFLKEKLALQMHEGKSQIYNTAKGIKFLGFRIYKDYRRLASDNVRRFKKRLRKFTYLFENCKIKEREVADSVRCWVAHSKYADTGSLRRKLSIGLMPGKLENSLKGILLDTA